MVTTMDSLTPKVSDIPQQGLVLRCDVTAEDLGLSERDALVQGALVVALELVNLNGSIRASGLLEGMILRQCVRCLKDFADPLSVSVDVEYVSEGAGALRGATRALLHGRVDAIGADEEDEPYLYTGDEIDLAPMLREQVILAEPMQPLCREDCQGLCGVCGQDLNVGRCRCPEEPDNSPFRVLRRLRDPGRGG
ncbi:MAG: hypothetical protein KatS3mg082_1637 [Nitrospiraceae bacterium]|jgi:uncharacterized protein|nr:MAG: hypothetical protein KatS3mg082_1637 [Nitrospiraceae bacterium]